VIVPAPDALHGCARQSPLRLEHPRIRRVRQSYAAVELTAGQQPFAIILGCSDSRVPAEIVFDQGLGDLFVIRVAGNIVAPSQVGSIEFAAARYGSRLVVVMAIRNAGPSSPRSRSCACRVSASRQPARDRGPGAPVGGRAAGAGLRAGHGAARAAGGARQHPRLREPLAPRLAVLEQLIRDEGVSIVGAEYSLETGVVEFFDGQT